MCGTIPVEVRVRGRFLVISDILRSPVEKETKRFVDGAGEQRGVDDIAPPRGGRKDGSAAENEVNEGGSIALNESGCLGSERLNIRCLHQPINEGDGQTGGTYGGSQCDEHVDLLVELRMNGEGSKGLSGPLTETNVADMLRLGEVEDVRNGVRDVVQGEVVD